MRTLDGNFFIVPNRLFRYAELRNEDENGNDDGLFTRKYGNITGLDYQDDDLMVEFWATSPQCENWHCHEWNELGKEEVMGRLPNHLPARLLAGVKEGDEIVLHFRANNAETPYSYELRLTAHQLGYRYERFGSFEETLAGLLRRATERAA